MTRPVAVVHDEVPAFELCRAGEAEVQHGQHLIGRLFTEVLVETLDPYRSLVKNLGFDQQFVRDIFLAKVLEAGFEKRGFSPDLGELCGRRREPFARQRLRRKHVLAVPETAYRGRSREEKKSSSI